MSSAFSSPSVRARAACPLPSLCLQFLTALLACLAPEQERADGLQPFCFLSVSCKRSCCLKSCFPLFRVCLALAGKRNCPAFSCVRREFRSETGELFCPHCQHFTCLMSAGRKETASKTVIVARSQLPGLPCCCLGTAAAVLGMEHQS